MSRPWLYVWVVVTMLVVLSLDDKVDDLREQVEAIQQILLEVK